MAEYQPYHKQRDEHVATDITGDFKRRRIGVLKRRAGMGQLHSPGNDDKENAAAKRDKHYRARDAALRIERFAGQGGDSIESQEGITGHGGAGDQDRQELIAIVEKRRQTSKRLRSVTPDVMYRQCREGHHNQQLHRHQQQIDGIGYLQPNDIDGGGDGDKRQQPGELGHRRHR